LQRRTAEKKGVNWRRMSDQILNSDVYAEKELVENKSVVYPDCKGTHQFATLNNYCIASVADLFR
jgi:hypothetical protein